MYYMDPSDLSTDGSRSTRMGREDITDGTFDMQPLHQCSFSTAIPISTKEPDCRGPISKTESETVPMLYMGKNLDAACTMDAATFVRLLSQSPVEFITKPSLGTSGCLPQHQAFLSTDPASPEVHSKQGTVGSSLIECIVSASASSLPVMPTAVDPFTTSCGVVCPRSSVLSLHGLSTPELLDCNRVLQECEIKAATAGLVARYSSLSLSLSPQASDARTSVHGTQPTMTVSNGSHDPIASLTPSMGSVNSIAGMATTVPSMASSMASLFFPPSASALHQKRRKAKKHAMRVPRPKNSFMHYRSDVSSMIMIELGMINNKIISKIAAERWNAESEPVKAWYRLKAKRCKEEHAKNYPGYKYAPNKKSIAVPSLPAHAGGEEKDMHSDYSEHLVTTQEPTGQQDRQGKQKQRRDTGNSNRTNSSQDPLSLGRSDSNRYGRADTYSDVSLVECHSDRLRRPIQNQRQVTTGLIENLHNDNALPIGFQGLVNVSLPSSGFPAVEQQIYLLQQMSSPGYHQTYPLASIPMVSNQSSLSDSISGASADANASSVSLVDPVHHWMSHRYVDPSSLMNHLGFSGKSTVVMDKATLCEAYHPTVKKTGYLSETREKEPPPLHGAGMSLMDPNLVLSQLYSEYNPNESWVSSLQQKQQQQQQQQHIEKEQEQDRRCLIKPAWPMLMSMADRGQGSLSTMDIVSWSEPNGYH